MNQDSGTRNSANQGPEPTPRLSRKLVFVIGFVLGVATCWMVLRRLPGPVFRVICIPPVDQEQYHRGVNQREVLLKAVVRAPVGMSLQYEWDFGDGSERYRAVVKDPYNIGVSHFYPYSESGKIYHATVTVRDLRTAARQSDTYSIKFFDDTSETRSKVARENGLWALHTAQKRQDEPGRLSQGHWGKTYRPGTTALAALAFQLNGYTSTGSRARQPYVETVDRAMTFLFRQLGAVPIQEQAAGNPDSNGNGLGLVCPGGNEHMYFTPLAMLAIIGDGRTYRTLSVGNKDVDGKTARELVREMVDYLAFAQTETGSYRGGWRHNPNEEADMSVTQWPVLGLLAAEELLGISPPRWVREELLEHWLARMQNESGAFGYRRPGKKTAPLYTAGGLICFSFCGLDRQDERVQKAIDALAHDWEQDNVGDLYSMYSVAKAALLARPSAKRFGKHDWRYEYDAHLTGTQRADGRWVMHTRLMAHRPEPYLDLGTAMGVLILTPRALPEPERSLWWLWITLSVLVLVIGYVIRANIRARRAYARAQAEEKADASPEAE